MNDLWVIVMIGTERIYTEYICSLALPCVSYAQVKHTRISRVNRG